MDVQSIVRRSNDFLGHQVEVEGLFVMKGGIGYLVDTNQDTECRLLAIHVSVMDLKPMLLAQVPALGGGKYLYCVPARLLGTLRASSHADFPCSIDSLRSFDVEVDGARFSVTDRSAPMP